jgi:hypothetical protein
MAKGGNSERRLFVSGRVNSLTPVIMRITKKLNLLCVLRAI